MWCALAARHKCPNSNGNQITYYKQFVHEIKDVGITWPIPLSQIPKFEKMNRYLFISKDDD